MYKKSNGNWKSDFILDGKRYQRSWNVKDKNKALKLENNWKKQLTKNSNITSSWYILNYCCINPFQGNIRYSI